MAMRLSLTTYVIPGDRYYRKLASNVRFIDATSQKPNETVCGHAPETHSDRSRAEIIRCLRKGAPCSSWQYCRCWLLHYFLDKSPRRIRHRLPERPRILRPNLRHHRLHHWWTGRSPGSSCRRISFTIRSESGPFQPDWRKGKTGFLLPLSSGPLRG